MLLGLKTGLGVFGGLRSEPGLKNGLGATDPYTKEQEKKAIHRVLKITWNNLP